jgi:hypothetical protein
MEKFSLNCACITYLYLVLVLFGPSLLAFSSNILSLAHRSRSSKALSAYEEIWLFFFGFQFEEANNDLND